MPEALYRLSLAVKEIYQAWEVLPLPTIMFLRRMVEKSMDVLRDHQNNPVGPLNRHSLSKLDDGRRRHLSAAAVVLCHFGLELDPQLRVC